VEARKGKKRH